MPRKRTDATERTAQNHKLVGRMSRAAGRQVTVREAERMARGEAEVINLPVAPTTKAQAKLTPIVADPREFIIRGITGYLTEDRVLDYRPEECRFIGDITCEVKDSKTYKGGTVVLSLETDDEFLETITDAIRLSRGHPLFIRLYELFPKPESPWADGTHPDDDRPARPGLPYPPPESDDDS